MNHLIDSIDGLHRTLRMATRFIGTVIVAVAGVFYATTPAVAQSNASSTIVTSSDAVGSVFLRSLPYALKADFTSTAVQGNLNQAAAGLNRKLATGQLIATPLASTSEVFNPALAAQINVLCIAAYKQDARNSECADAILSKLTVSGSSQATVRELVSSLDGLTADSKVDASRFVIAVETHNTFVREASIRFLENPVQEFVVIHAVLSSLANAAAIH